jgi:RHS repeat-associated protein
LPVQLAETAAFKGHPARSGQVTVQIMPHATAVRAGVRGVVLQVSATGGGLALGGSVALRLSYSGFAGEYGGGWASRLRLAEMPACSLTTPSIPACRIFRPLPTVNNTATSTLTAAVPLPALGLPVVSPVQTAGIATTALLTSDSGSGTVVVAQAGASGATGDYTATPLLSSGTWAAQQGDFTYHYPVAVPPSLGGSAPQIALDYDAQSIDSETSAGNTQAGWIGDGWGYSPGYIERSYQSCFQDGIAGSGDECWAGDNAVLSLAGHSSVLVKDGATGAWHLQSDDGSSVQLVQNGPNGLWNGQYWVVTTTDGTSYYFGRNHLPGTSNGGAATNSAWGVPVYTPNAGDPCYSSANGTSSYCANMGWRWNLDYVIDPMGNLTIYDYAAETNYYKLGGGQNGGNGTLTQYDRGGYLTSIAYGWLLSDAQGGGTKPAAQVVFGSSDRCTSTSDSTCTANENGNYWPDVPWDLNCGSSGTCTNYAPSYWTTQMLTSITTEVLPTQSSTSYNTVDTYTLNQCSSSPGYCFPAGAGSDPVIFLNSITRTGNDGGSQSLPAVSFTPQEIDNRVPGLTPAAPPVYRPRVAGITTSAGALIAVNYGYPSSVVPCSRLSGGTMPPSADANTMPCFPVYWTPPQSGQIQDWFNKTLISSVTVSDGTGAASSQQVTSYAYSPGGAAWHQNESPVVPKGQRTWDQYRGYAQVTVMTGMAPDRVSKTVTSYMRGMDGDPLSSGGTASASLVDSQGASHPDYDWLSGLVLETDTFEEAGVLQPDKKVMNGGWSYYQTAMQDEPGSAPTLTAHMLTQAQTATMDFPKVPTWRSGVTTTYYDGDGRVAVVDNKPNADGSNETCTSTSYATPPAGNPVIPGDTGNPMMLSYPAQVTEVTGAANVLPFVPIGAADAQCPGAGSSNLVSDTRYYYDQPSSAASSLGTPGVLASPGGLVTGVMKADVWPSNSSEHWEPQSATVYDKYGRVTSSQDGDGNQTGTSYIPATGAIPTEIKVTNAKNWVTDTQLDQSRQLPTTVTDPNGNVTTESYDAVGRLTSVTKPIGQASGDATYQYSYTVTGTSPPTVTTQTLREDGSYATKVSIYDGMGQLRQVQQSTADNEPGRVVSDTFYDSHGWTVKASAPYYDKSISPSTTLLVTSDVTVPSQTRTTYDGQGRVLSSALYSLNNLQWETDTSYPGMDEADVAPPAGGTATSSFTNVLGQVTQTYQYHTAGPTGVRPDAARTQYTYFPSGQTQSVTDDSGNVTSYTYNFLGRKTGANSPESGATSWTYDNAGNVHSVTTGRGTVVYTYDELNRKTAEYQGSTSGTRLASWAYDTASGGKGQIASSTSYDSHGAWTEQVAGYTPSYGPTGTNTTIPSSAGFGTNPSFTTTDTYTPLTGLLESKAYSQDGGLPAETVSYAYDLAGLPVSSGGASAYVAGTLYTPLGQVARAVFGMRGGQIARTYAWDQGTGRLLTAVTDVQQLDPVLYNADAAADTVGYTYNPAGLLTSVSDLENGAGANGSSATELQCFSYSQLGQLKEAWTDTGAVNTTAAGIGGCAHSTPSTSVIGGPAPYWKSFTDNALGDRTLEVIHDPQGTTANNVTQSLTYPAAGSGSGLQPVDAPSQVTMTVAGGGSVTTTPAYDGAGDTASQLNTSSGAGAPSGPPAVSNVAYRPDGRVSQVTTANGTSQYAYDGSGSLIFQGDPTKGSVLYLDGGTEQLTLSGGQVAGVRLYPGPEGTTVVRSSAATSPGSVFFEVADPQGTSSELVTDTPDANAPGGFDQAAVTRRWFDPYGNPVAPGSGTQAVAGSWPDNRAFVGRPADGDTGLGLLGARQYDPVTGMFLSPDPVYQPGTLAGGGYTYAADNPATYADPTGLYPLPPPIPDGCGFINCPPATGTPGTGNAANGTPNRNGCKIAILNCVPTSVQLEGGSQATSGNNRNWDTLIQECGLLPGLEAAACINLAAQEDAGGPPDGQSSSPGGSNGIEDLAALALNLIKAAEEAAQEEGFIENVLRELGAKRITTGRIFDAAGNEIGPEITSGNSALSEAVQEFLQNSPDFPDIPAGAKYTVADHVEAQYAMLMREDGITSADVVINKRICTGVMSCTAAIRAILPSGSTMNVWFPGVDTPVTIEGVGSVP